MGRRILAVDDNEIVGWTLAARLWAADFDVVSVQSADEAFEALNEGRFDLILMDLNMPGCDGLSALELIVAEGLAPGVPVVLLTSSDDIHDMRRARDLGALGYLTKEESGGKLAAQIDRILGAPDTIWIDDHHRIARQVKTRQAGVAPILRLVSTQNRPIAADSAAAPYTDISPERSS